MMIIKLKKITWKHIIEYNLSILDRNTRIPTTVYKLLVLDRNT